MEVIFDVDTLKPRLSPTMRTALSVLGLIGRTLVETNKCMKERLADEARQAPTLDDVMKQSGLHIPGLEEALAQFMGGGDEARKVAAMVASAPDPVTLLNRLMANFGAEPAPAKSPLVTPPPAAANVAPPRRAAPPANVAPPASEPGNLAAFRADFTREGRQAATSPAPSSEPPGLPLFRPDFTREARDGARAAASQPVPTPAAPTLSRAAPPSLIAGVQLRLDGLTREVQASKVTVKQEVAEARDQLAALLAEWRQQQDALASHEASPPAADLPAPEPASPPEEPAPTVAAAAAEPAPTVASAAADPAAIAAPAAAAEPAPTAAEDLAPAVPPADKPAQTVSQPAVTPPSDELVNEPEPAPLPTSATAEEVAQAFELMDAFAEQARVADEQNLASIAELKRDIAAVAALVLQRRAPQKVTAAHAP